MKTNFNIVPRKKIYLKDLEDYTKILHIFKREGIDRYVYAIHYKDDIGKYGIKHKKGHPYGERVYTQIGYIPGWKKPLLTRSKKTGIAIKAMIEELNPTSFHKDDVILEIFDFTNYPFQWPDSDKLVYAEMQNAEEQLKLEYYQTRGRYPVGNLKQEGFRVISPKKETWNELFN